MSDHTRPVTIDMIQRATAAYYGGPAEHLKSDARNRCMLTPRWVAIALCVELTKLPSAVIAPAFSRNARHVWQCAQDIFKRMESDIAFAAEVHTIRANIADLAHGEDIDKLPTHPLARIRSVVAEMKKTDFQSYAGMAIVRLAEGRSVDEVVRALGYPREKVESIFADPAGAMRGRRLAAPRYRPKPVDDEPFDFEAFAAAGNIRIVPSDARKAKATALPTMRRIRAANVTAAICGDPTPGRSALDQREASNGL